MNPAHPFRASAQLLSITPDRWRALAGRRIFFGHQSVGRDLMLGVHEIIEAHPEIGLRLVESIEPEQVEGPALIDGRIGRNREPASKSEAFDQILARGLGANAIALYKFCYVDVGAQTDVEALFDAYIEQVRRITRRYPDITLLHVTIPLKTAPPRFQEWMRRLRGGTPEATLNSRRHRFNERMREQFGDFGTVFDLARLESTRADGSRAYSRLGSQRVEMLAPEWTYDGGHLNERARRSMAEQFLIMLAEVASPTAAIGDELDSGLDAATQHR